MSQTAYLLNQAVAREGLVDYELSNPEIITRLGRLTVIEPGTLVVQQAADTNVQCSLGDATGEVTGNYLGFSIFDPGREKAEANGEWAIGAAIPILRKGYIWLLCESDIAQGVTAFVRFAAGAGGTKLGKVRKDADTATAVALPGVRADMTIAAGGLCRFAVNLP